MSAPGEMFTYLLKFECDRRLWKYFFCDNLNKFLIMNIEQSSTLPLLYYKIRIEYRFQFFAILKENII